MTTVGSAYMPSLDGATAWLNSAPLTPAGLRGHVVLVDFWTYTCINWLRTQPYVRAWHRAYRGDGLIVLGVHTPEFAFEHDLDRVRRATAERGIDYPVAVDNDYALWRAFANHYWPALYFTDRDGIVRDRHIGEGGYAHSERILQDLLGVRRDPVRVTGTGVEADADWRHLRSPETYLGQARGERRGEPDRLRVNQWAVTGAWSIGYERIRLDRPGGAIAYRFHARDVHLVLSSAVDRPIPFEVSLDGLPPGPAHGTDVAPDGTGVLDGGRLYQLVRQPDRVREHTVQITFTEPGAEAYAFTFG